MAYGITSETHRFIMTVTVFGRRSDKDGRAAEPATKLKAVVVPAPRGP